MRGIVYQLNVKPLTPGERGLPKTAVPEALMGAMGLIGDYNRYRTEKRNRDPDQAVLIYPLEMLLQLQSEGWPARPGDLGENITTQGIPYDAFAPGRRYAAGGVELEISKAATPCKNLYLLAYVGAAKGPAFIKTLVDRRGWYARVVKEGCVRAGQPINAL